MGTILLLILGIAVVMFVLPQMPHWARAGFWTALSVSQILTGDALFAAIYAAIAVSEWHKP